MHYSRGVIVKGLFREDDLHFSGIGVLSTSIFFPVSTYFFAMVNEGKTSAKLRNDSNNPQFASVLPDWNGCVS